jgi:hypothetical protein
VNIIPCFIKLANTYNICFELWDVVDTDEDTMLVILVAEDDCVATLNPDHRSITESDRAPDVDVKLDEGGVRTRHVIGGASVDHPFGGAPPLLLLT